MPKSTGFAFTQTNFGKKYHLLSENNLCHGLSVGKDSGLMGSGQMVFKSYFLMHSK
jgi:hypothetical protein